MVSGECYSTTMFSLRFICLLSAAMLNCLALAQTPQEIVGEFSASHDWVQAEAALENLPAEVYPKCWQEWQALLIPQQALRLGFAQVLFSRWAQADLRGALQAVDGHPADDYLLSEAVLDGLARGAWVWEEVLLESLAALRTQPQLLAKFMPVLAGHIPGPSVEAAYARLKKLAPLAGEPAVVRELVMNAAGTIATFPDTESEWREALAFVNGLPTSEFKGQLQSQLWLNPPSVITHETLWAAALEQGTSPQEQGWVLSRWFRADRDAAMKALLALPPDGQMAQVAEALACHVVSVVPDAAGWLLRRENVGEWSPRALGLLLRYYLGAETVEALAWLRQHSAKIPDEAWKYAHDFHSGNADFARLWLELRCGTPAAIERGWFGSALKTLGKVAPEEAVSWIDALLSGEKRDYYLSEQIRLWGAERPREALALMVRLQKINARDSARAELFEGWAKRDFSAALKTANTLQGDERLRAVCYVIKSGSHDHLNAAAEAFLKLLQEADSDSWPFGFAADELFKAMVAARGKGAVDWLRERVPQAHLAPLARRLYHSMSRSMADELDDFMAKMPDDAIRQAWLVERVQFGYQNPLRSLRLAKDIRDPSQRREACLQVMQAWKNLDPVFAKHALPGLELTEEIKAELNALLEKP